MTMQTKILAAIDQIAADRDLEVVREFEWSNRGTLRFQRKGEFYTFLTIEVDFSHRNLCTKGDIEMIVWYDGHGDVEKFLSQVTAQLCFAMEMDEEDEVKP